MNALTPAAQAAAFRARPCTPPHQGLSAAILRRYLQEAEGTLTAERRHMQVNAGTPRAMPRRLADAERLAAYWRDELDARIAADARRWSAVA